MPWILPIAPGGEQQEISGHQPCRHDHRSKLFQLFNIHLCIVTLSPSNGVALAIDLVGIQSCLQFQAKGRAHITVIMASP